MVKNMTLSVCVYKSYERSKIARRHLFRFTGLTCDEQTAKVLRTNQRPKCKIGNTKRNDDQKQTVSILRLGAFCPSNKLRLAAMESISGCKNPNKLLTDKNGERILQLYAVH